MSSYAHGQMGAIQETHSAVFERALPYWRLVSNFVKPIRVGVRHAPPRGRLGVITREDAQLAPALAVHLSHTCFRRGRVAPESSWRVVEW